MRTELASGAWIEHVPIQDLRGRHRRDYERAGKPRVAPGSVDASGDIDIGVLLAGMDVTSYGLAKKDALWAIIIGGWSYDAPVPVFDRGSGEVTGTDALDDIPIDDYDEIEQLLAPFEAKLNRRPDPKSSTSSGSNGSSPARAGGSRRG